MYLIIDLWALLSIFPPLKFKMATTDLFTASTQYNYWRFTPEQLVAQRASLIENANQQKGKWI